MGDGDGMKAVEISAVSNQQSALSPGRPGFDIQPAVAELRQPGSALRAERRCSATSLR